MWVFTRPRGGQDYYLLMHETRTTVVYCPIQRFDGFDKFPAPWEDANKISAFAPTIYFIYFNNGELSPSTVRNRISRSEMKVRTR